MDLNVLLQKAKRLNNEVQLSHELPSVERSLAQVLRETSSFHTRVTQHGSKDLQAHLLLGSKGIDLPKITNKLVSFNTRKTFEPVEQVTDVDIEKFLRNERENAINSVIESVNYDLDDLEKSRKWRDMQQTWRQQKIRVLDAFVGPSEDFVDIQRLPEVQTVSESVAVRRGLSDIELSFAKELVHYNACVIAGESRPHLMQRFAANVAQLDDMQLTELWAIMLYMSDVTTNTKANPITQRQQNFEYITQAKSYLESRYKIYMSSVVDIHRFESGPMNITNVPTLVESYVRSSLSQQSTFGLQDTCGDLPLWPLVYCALRCGDLKTALAFIRRADKGFEDFAQLLEEKLKDAHQKINAKLTGQLKFHYVNKIKNSTDAFKKAAYCVMLGCDNHQTHAEVIKTTDDFLWIQLCIARANADRDYNAEQLTYAGLQTLIIEKYGEQYFKGGEQPHVYFAALALTGQFEAAIEFLVRQPAYRPHAVHMAIALHELCLLAGPRSLEQPLLSLDRNDPAPLRRLNLARLLRLYVADFEHTDIVEALNYYYLLRDYKHPDGRNMFIVCVCDLIVKTGAYAYILGQPEAAEEEDAVASGIYEQFSWGAYATQDVAKLVADELAQKGMLELAVQVYDLADDHNNALKQLCSLLSQHVHLPHRGNALRARLRRTASALMKRLTAGKLEVVEHTKETFKILYELLIFFDAYHERNFTIAFEALNKSGILPSTPDDADACLVNFKHLSPDICKLFPDTMFAAMEIIYVQYKSARQRGLEYKQLEALRQKAKAITAMAAIIPYRMPSSVNSSLLELEVKML